MTQHPKIYNSTVPQPGTSLAPFGNESIDWDLSPEMAVTLYLEWGNNNWRSEHPPVRSRHDVSVYFVMDSWQWPPVVRLVRRNSEEAIDLAVVALPPELVALCRVEYGQLRGVFEPLPQIKDWLRQELAR